MAAAQPRAEQKAARVVICDVSNWRAPRQPRNAQRATHET